MASYREVGTQRCGTHVLALLVLAGPVAMVAVLFELRRRSPHPRTPRVDRVLAVVGAVASLVLVAAWPSATVRGWLGYVDPEQCLGKNRPAPTRTGPPAGIEALKADIRQQRLDRGPANPLDAVTTVQLDRVTGPGSSGATDEHWLVGGTDLGHPFVLDGRLGLVFGDTFAIPQASGPGWRSNVLGWVADPTGDRMEITTMTQGPNGHARELLGSLKINGWEQTVIPTNSVVVGDQIVLHWMSVACWGEHGRWAVRESGLAVSRDRGATFTRVPGARWPAGSPFAQVAFVPDGAHVYVFGIPEGRDGAARLARVPADQLLDLGAWRYWDGQDWQADPAEATTLVPPRVGELSVAWNEHHDVWLMMYLDEQRGGIVMRTADELTGPWSRARLVVSSLEVPTLYAPFQLPGGAVDDTVRYTMSRFDIYNVVLMETQLTRRDVSG